MYEQLNHLCFTGASEKEIIEFIKKKAPLQKRKYV